MNLTRVCYRGVDVQIGLTRRQMDMFTYDTEPLEWPEELLPIVRVKAEVQYRKIRDQIIANEREDYERREASCGSTT